MTPLLDALLIFIYGIGKSPTLGVGKFNSTFILLDAVNQPLTVTTFPICE